MTSFRPLTRREASIGTAPAARIAWIFFGLLLQLHNALQAFWISWKSFSSLEETLLRLLLSGWIMCTWKSFNNKIKLQLIAAFQQHLHMHHIITMFSLRRSARRVLTINIKYYFPKVCITHYSFQMTVEGNLHFVSFGYSTLNLFHR